MLTEESIDGELCRLLVGCARLSATPMARAEEVWTLMVVEKYV